MIELRIDGHVLTVVPGTTLLEAARSLNIELPTLCHRRDLPPNTSCMICAVHEMKTDRLLPACSALAEQHMVIETANDKVQKFRRTTLELLFSEHVGECIAPCQMACPADLQIPLMMQEIAANDFAAAIRTIKMDIALPGTLGYVCTAPCENACRRKKIDNSAAICLLKRAVALEDLQTSIHYAPAVSPPSGYKVVVVGGGPTGLAAAYYLRLFGHACSLLEADEHLGGHLREYIELGSLPAEVLNQEIEMIIGLGIEIRVNTVIDSPAAITELLRQFDAVVLAIGQDPPCAPADLGFEVTVSGIPVDPISLVTVNPGVYAGGGCIRRRKLAVQSVADGKRLAHSIHQGLSGPIGRPDPPSTLSKLGKLNLDELQEFLLDTQLPSETTPKTATHLTRDDAIARAQSCLQCGCRAADSCKLRLYADQYQADIRRYPRDGNQKFRRITDHPYVIYEPGKCIKCGLCVAITRDGGEDLGLTFVGRGFDIRVEVPLNEILERGLRQTARQCVDCCPSGALSFKPNWNAESS